MVDYTEGVVMISAYRGLTFGEARRLTMYKWQYSIGLTREEMARIVFLHWMVRTARLGGCRDGA